MELKRTKKVKKLWGICNKMVELKNWHLVSSNPKSLMKFFMKIIKNPPKYTHLKQLHLS